MCYLENAVLDVTDLNLLVGASIGSRGGQQNLKSKRKQISSGFFSNDHCSPQVGECIVLSALTCQRL